MAGENEKVHGPAANGPRRSAAGTEDSEPDHFLPRGRSRIHRFFSRRPPPARSLLAALAAWGASLTAAPMVPAPPPPSETITSAQQFGALKDTAGDREYPLKAAITINYVDADWHLLFVDWAGTGIFLNDRNQRLPLQAGQHVQLDGFALPGREQILWEKTRLTVLPDAATPRPIAVSATIDHPEAIDRRRVELEGLVIRQERVDPTHARLRLVASGWIITAQILLQIDEPVPLWLGAFVRVSGLFSVKQDASSSDVAYELWVAQRAAVSVVGWLREDPRFITPALPIGQVAGHPPGDLVRIEGSFLSAEPGRSITVQDPTGRIRLLTRQIPPFNAGDPIEAIGYPVGPATDLTLREAVFRPRLALPGAPASPRSPPPSAARPENAASPTPVTANVPPASAPADKPAPVETITEVHQFWSLRVTAGDREYPVQATLTINYYDTDWHMLYVDWQGTGAYLRDGGERLPFTAGQRVEINGFARPGEEQILWEKTRINFLTDSAPPPPQVLTDTIENAGKIDLHRVEVAGLVTEQDEVDQSHLRVVLVSTNWSIIAQVHYRADEPVPQWQGAFVRMKGLFSVKQDSMRAGVIYELWVNQLSDVTVSGRLQNDPRFAPPPIPIEQLAARPPTGFVHIAGTFQGAEPGQSITLRDPTGQIRLLTRQIHQLNRGDPIEAIGRPTGTGLDFALREGIFRPLPALAGRGGNANLGLPKLRIADQIRALGPEEADRGYPVQLNGVVTWSDPAARTFFFQDASGAAKVVLPADGSIPTPEFKASVLVSGVTRAGEFVSAVEATAVGHGPGSPLPPPHPTTLEQALTGVDYAHWVEARGYVRSATKVGSQTRLEFTTASGEFIALAPPLEHPADLVGALVQFRAVCDAIVNDRRQLVGVRFLIPAPDLLQILEPAPADPFTTPIRPIGSLLQYGAASQLNHRVQIYGVVVLHQPGSLLQVQDGRDSLLVLSRQADPLQPGDRVDVVGFPGHSGWRLMMRDAVYRRTGHGPEPAPLALEASEPARTDLDGQLVHVRGTLFSFSRIGAGSRLQLQAGKSLFEAYWPGGDFPGLEPGSVLELTGVYRVELDEYLKPRSFTVNLRTASDLRVVNRPPWWTAARILWATAALLAFGIVSVVWGVALSRKNRLLHHTQQALNESNTALEARVAERTRALRLEVAERQHSEARLAEERRLLRTLIDNLPVHLFVKDTTGHFIIGNLPPTLQSRAGSGLDITGKTDFDLHPEAIARLYQADDQHVIETGEPLLNREEPGGFGENAGWFSTSKLPLRDVAGKIIGLIGISQDITARKQAEAERELLHRKLLDTSRQAGMAEVATSVLHNVGNVLNSVNVSANLVLDRVQHSELTSLSRVADLLKAHTGDLVSFLTQDTKGRALVPFLLLLAEQVEAEHDTVLAELRSLLKNISHVNEIVSLQQNYAKAGGITEVVDMVEMVEDALRINSGSFDRHHIELVREYIDRPALTTQRHKVIQILVNLINNAQHACGDSTRPDKKVILRVTRHGDRAQVTVTDNGVGILPEHRNRIFTHGFTTRKTGHGFGLNSGSLTAKDLGGSLTVHSDGPGQGAVFTLDLPLETVSRTDGPTIVGTTAPTPAEDPTGDGFASPGS